MARCTCGDVSIECRGGCGCICYSNPPRRCSVFCFEPEGPVGGPVEFTQGPFGTIGPDDKIKLTCKGVTLGGLAVVLDKHSKDDIFVPVGRMHLKKTISKTGTLEQLLKSLGLHSERRSRV